MAELLEVRNLVKIFRVSRGLLGGRTRPLRAVDGVSFSLARGQTLGLVGESGCGKTTISRAILRLIEPTSGEIRFNGLDLPRLSRQEMQQQQRHIQPIFQDPYSSLNPRLTVAEIVGEPLRVHERLTPAERRRRVQEILGLVGLLPEHMNRFPHEFSGGQRQRIAIARALVLRPTLVIGDEPVSALDVSVRAQVLNLLARLQQRFELSSIIISHDLGVIRYICHRAAVMYLGRIVEQGPVESLFAEPLHPYTQALISAVPRPNPRRARQRIILSGEVPSPLDPPPGCHFHPRCPQALEICGREAPAARSLAGGRMAACHLLN